MEVQIIYYLQLILKKTSLIDLQKQLAEIPFAISQNRLAEFDDDVADVH